MESGLQMARKRKRSEAEEKHDQERVTCQRLDSSLTAVNSVKADNSVIAVTSEARDRIDAPELPLRAVEELHIAPPGGMGSRFWQILGGAMSDLPRMPTHTIRIFLSSTFSDFKAERNRLPLLAYPKLEAWCLQRHLDFQVVDMRWGVTDDVVEDHQVSPLCIEEIKTCQQLSCGPNFVVLLGDRYGWQGFPPRIQCEEFRRLLAEVERIGAEPTALLQKWFLEDENAVPPEYVLQPIHVHLKHYHDNSEKEAREADRQEWKLISAQLQKTLRLGARAARERGDFTEDQERKYFMSVTEEEIQQGIFHTPEPQHHTMCYHRNLRGIADTHQDEEKVKFIDMDENRQPDREAAMLRQGLLEKKLPSRLPGENIREYSVSWRKVPLEKSEEQEHQEYLERFCGDFVSDVKRLVEKQCSRDEGNQESRDKLSELYQEVLHHARFGNTKCEVFCGRSDEVNIIHDYLRSAPRADKPPFIIHGMSGMGKTALMAYIASRFHQWFPQGSVCVLRFLGTSPLSSNITETLHSLMEQLCAVYHLPQPTTECLEMFGGLRRAFHSLLRTLAGTLTCPLVFILDSVDQLSPQCGAHHMVWLPRLLPPNVYFIISMLSSDCHQCLPLTQRRFADRAHYLALPPLSEHTGDCIMEAHLTRVGRRLTADQRQVVVDAFKSLRHPLFLKLVIDEAKQWASYLPPVAISLLPPKSDPHLVVQESIKRLFESMESKHGAVFVRHALGYLTCGKGGLTTIEMEDILSCDDDVLNEVYQYHEPPLEGVVRIPSLLWSRLQFALKEYICERRVDGKVVIAWYHRQFWTAAVNMYLSTEAVIQSRHKALAEMFVQESGIRRTITLHQLCGKVIQNADRRVKVQPLVVSNLRKLQAVPYHLLEAGQHEALASRCLLNYQWLLLKLQALGVTMVIQEYTGVVHIHHGVALVRKLLELCYDALRQDPHLLAYHVVVSFQHCTLHQPLLHQFVVDAQQWLHTTAVPLLLPTRGPLLHHQLRIDSPLTFSMLLGQSGKLSPDQQLLVTHSRKNSKGLAQIQVLHIKSRDIIASVDIQKATPYIVCPDSRHFVYVQDRYVQVHEVECGDMAAQFSYTDTKYDKVVVRCLAVSSNGELLCVCVKTGRPSHQAMAKKWQTQYLIHIVHLTSHSVLCELKFEHKKLIEQLYFVQEDAAVVGVCRDRVLVYNTGDLSVRHDLLLDPYLLEPSTLVLQADHIVAGCSAGREVRVCTVDYTTPAVLYSQHNVHLTEEEEEEEEEEDITVQPFALHTSLGDPQVLVGTWGKRAGQPAATCICLWQSRTGDDQTYRRLLLAPHGNKPASCLTATPDWHYALVGWHCGVVGVVDLGTMEQLQSMTAHGHSITHMYIQQNCLLSLSLDNTLKVWDLARLLEEAQTKEGAEEMEEKRQGLDEEEEEEECVDLVATDQGLITAPADPHSAPRCCTYSTGAVDGALSTRLHQLYTNSLPHLDLPQGIRLHSVLTHHNQVLVHQVRRRDALTVLVTGGMGGATQHMVAGSTLHNIYNHLLVPPGVIHAEPPPGDMLMYGLHDGYLTVYDVTTLTQLKSIADIPKITDEVPDLYTTRGKKRLQSYKVGLTVDNRYFLVVNLGGGASGKYIDVIQVQESQYDRRVALPKLLSTTLLSDGVYFLCSDQEEEELVCLSAQLCKQNIGERGRDYSYRQLIYTGDTFLSPDGSLGISIDTRGHSVTVWQLPSLENVKVMQGHTHLVMSAQISADNSVMVTGSHDNTIRLWDVCTGLQVALFNTSGRVERVVLSPDTGYVGALVNAAPKRKRAVILGMRNVGTGARRRQLAENREKINGENSK